MSNALMPRLKGLGAAATMGLILVGLPLLLIAINAVPTTVPTLNEVWESLRAPDDGSLVLFLLGVTAWLAWAVMTAMLVVEIVARLKGTRAPQLPGLGLPQGAARGLVTAAALLFIAVPAVGTADAAQGATISDQRPSVTQTATQTTPTRGDVTTEAPADSQRYVVAQGDSLWKIAEEQLGDGARYVELVDLNQALVGAAPHHLQPGWELRLPETRVGAQERRVVVQAGETLSSLAATHLGDPGRYLEVFEASRTIVQPGGVRLTDPDLVGEGWTVAIPVTQAPEEVARLDSLHDRQHQPSTETEPPTRPAPKDGPAQAQQPSTPAAEENHRPAETVPLADTPGAETGDSLELPWILLGLTGAGSVLAGGLYAAVRARRRVRSRMRRPGRAVTPPPPELGPVEKTVMTLGAAEVDRVEFVDQALLRLAAAVATREGTPMPRVAAVELGGDTMTLHLTDPQVLPGPWRGSPDHTHWVIDLSTPAAELGPDPAEAEAPYPLLITIGEADTGEVWLLNFEEMGTLTLTGDQTYARDFARHVAAEVAVNAWSRRVRIECVGVAEETVGMNERLSYHDTAEAAEAAAGDVLAAAVRTSDRAHRHGVDVATARTGRVDDDAWTAGLLLLDATSIGVVAGVDHLATHIAGHQMRSATSLVVAGEHPGTGDAVVLHLTPTGRLVMEQVGLNLVAPGLTSDEARGCAMLLAHSEEAADTPIGVDETAIDGWEAYADHTGSLRSEHTVARAESTDEPHASLLQLPDDTYLQTGAVSVDDLESVAPQVPTRVRAEVEDVDPTLDEEVADWFSTTPTRPRLSLLGPVKATTFGKPLVKRKPYFTELLAFLALNRRHGVTPDVVRDAFGLELTRVRDYVGTVRDWLGTNARTQELHLPHADKAPASRLRGVNVYQVDHDLLVDFDLFQRLHLRGKARGGERGIGDLTQALELVTGRPFDQLRAGGWSWLFESGERHDEYAKIGIADVAFIVVTHCLAVGDLDRARAAAEIAQVAAPFEDTTHLCNAAVTEALGDPERAAQILHTEVFNRSDAGEAPAELSERTETIIRNREWKAS